jgi:hypothetical protein
MTSWRMMPREIGARRPWKQIKIGKLATSFDRFKVMPRQELLADIPGIRIGSSLVQSISTD